MDLCAWAAAAAAAATEEDAEPRGAELPPLTSLGLPLEPTAAAAGPSPPPSPPPLSASAAPGAGGGASPSSPPPPLAAAHAPSRSAQVTSRNCRAARPSASARHATCPATVYQSAGAKLAPRACPCSSGSGRAAGARPAPCAGGREEWGGQAAAAAAVGHVRGLEGRVPQDPCSSSRGGAGGGGDAAAFRGALHGKTVRLSLLRPTQEAEEGARSRTCKRESPCPSSAIALPQQCVHATASTSPSVVQDSGGKIAVERTQESGGGGMGQGIGRSAAGPQQKTREAGSKYRPAYRAEPGLFTTGQGVVTTSSKPVKESAVCKGIQVSVSHSACSAQLRLGDGAVAGSAGLINDVAWL